jgi:hypothetical protein
MEAQTNASLEVGLASNLVEQQCKSYWPCERGVCVCACSHLQWCFDQFQDFWILSFGVLLMVLQSMKTIKKEMRIALLFHLCVRVCVLCVCVIIIIHDELVYRFNNAQIIYKFLVKAFCFLLCFVFWWFIFSSSVDMVINLTLPNNVYCVWNFLWKFGTAPIVIYIPKKMTNVCLEVWGLPYLLFPFPELFYKLTFLTLRTYFHVWNNKCSIVMHSFIAERDLWPFFTKKKMWVLCMCIIVFLCACI